MTLRFPPDFLWGTATAAHQVEGNNTRSDWWDWELEAGSPVAEPSGDAIEHYSRYEDDIALLAELGFNTYRFSVEWARVEPDEGSIDDGALHHYRNLVDTVRAHGMEPMVTLHHFTNPAWLSSRGGWLWQETPDRFARHTRRVVEAFGDTVDWYCTINEPGIVAFGSYLGALGWPPIATDHDSWMRAIDGLRRGHIASFASVKDLRPEARVGATHSMGEYESTPAGRPLMEYVRKHTEDDFLEVCVEDDFIGVQTYTRIPFEVLGVAAPAIRALVGWGPLRRSVIPRMLRSRASAALLSPPPDDEVRRTAMGYEYRPRAVAATVRRVAGMLPGKDIVVTEHGVATDDDAERIEFITEGLTALHGVIEDGIPLRGYLHWSAFDNFEWALGYRTRFGIVDVDRSTQERSPKPSAHFLGEIARTGVLANP